MSLYSRAETDAQSLKVLSTTEKNSVDKYDHDNTLITDGDSVVTGAQGYATAARRVVFVDESEATLEANTSRGLNSPGWWEYMTYTDAAGETRHKAQQLVSMGSAPANTGDADDDIVADAPMPVISISVGGQPADVGNGTSTIEVPSVARTFSVTATVTEGGTLEYQWQRKAADQTRWVNITSTLDSSAYTGFTTATLTVVAGALTDLDLNNYQYRVKIASNNGAEEVISNAATLKLVDVV
jgi:hypothetical protein